MYSMQCILDMVCIILAIANCTLFNILCTCTLYKVHITSHPIHYITPYTSHPIHHTLYITPYTLHPIHHTIYITPYTLHHILYITPYTSHPIHHIETFSINFYATCLTIKLQLSNEWAQTFNEPMRSKRSCLRVSVCIYV